MDFVPVAMLGSLLWKFVDFLKSVRVKDTNAIFTQAIVWLAGVGSLFLVGETQFASEITVGSLNLASLDGATKLFVGLMLGSTVSAVFDVKKAIDGSDSAKQPPLIG